VTVYLELLHPNGSIIFSAQEMTNNQGQFTFNIPKNLSSGSYILTIAAYQNTSILINSMEVSLVVLPPVTTTSSTTTANLSTTSVQTSSSSATSTTSSGINVGLIGAVIAIIIIVIAAVALLRRRK